MNKILHPSIQPSQNPCNPTQPSPHQINKPIFLVGHARGGSTIFAGIINQHTHVQSNYIGKEKKDLNEHLKTFLDETFHVDYAESVEQKQIWFQFFSGENVFSHMGKELIVEDLELSDEEKNNLISQLTENFSGKRFLSKSPTNSFRVKIIPKLFPGAKIVAIYRKGAEVVSSWGQRGYGFGKKISNDELKCRKLGYRKGIEIFSRKWSETITYLESIREEMGFLVVTYDDLIDHTSETLETVFNYLELPIEDFIYKIKLDDQRSIWTKKIPWWHHAYLAKCTAKGMELYNHARLFSK